VSMEKELRRNVALKDDSSMPSIYDLRVGPADAPEVAVECVGAIDPIFTEAYNVGPVREPLELAIKGDWTITLTPVTVGILPGFLQ
jgi:hypothetical protein